MKKVLSIKRVPNQKQKGQVIIILLLLMLVALSIGLALTQRSVTDVATSTQSEQSSRAFSAAEAGIAKALTGSIQSGSSFSLENNSSVVVDSSVDLPVAGTFAGIEYPPIGRETTAQFWFIDPAGVSPITYSSPNVDVYFGNESTTDNPALEIKILMESGGSFYTKSYYLDSTARVPSNNFTLVSGCGSHAMPAGILGDNRSFFCRYTLGPIKNVASPTEDCPSVNCRLILARVRLLYSNQNHTIALSPPNPNPLNAQFPPQIQVYNAVGTSGQSQKNLQAFKVKDVVPPWFDFAVFSVNEINK